jgi:hypothetical protein
MDYLDRIPNKDPSEHDLLENAHKEYMNNMFGCIDCGINTLDAGEYYMVKTNIWKLTGLGISGGMLCINCLEKRIGRKLTPDDFNLNLPINKIDNSFGHKKSNN